MNPHSETPESKLGHAPSPPASTPPADTISIDQYLNLVQLRTAVITAAEAIPNKDKLYQLTLQLGNETRTIVSGIRTFFPDPSVLLGKTIIILANLEPKKLGGIMSQGMLLAAEDDEGNFALLVPETPVKSGAKIR